MKINAMIATVGTVVACGTGLGCGSKEGPLAQNWTIQGTTSPTACTASGATQMRVIVIRSNGVAEATDFAACNAFNTSLSLDEDTYTGTATFLDANGIAVSQTKLLGAFSIIDGETTRRTIDFVASDFLPR